MKTLLEKNSIEYFRQAEEFKVFFIKNGKVSPFSEISLDDATALRHDLEKYPRKLQAMEKAGVTDPMKQLEVYAGCVFGAFGLEPDFVFGRRKSWSYSPCPLRKTGRCPYSEVVCDKGSLVTPQFVLTPRQVEVLSHTKEDISEGEMASRLFVSPNTLRRHKQHLREILNARSMVGLAMFAVRYHI